MAETFGNTNIETTPQGLSPNEIDACKFTSGSAGTIEFIKAYLYTGSGTCNAKCAIYNASLNLLANGTTVGNTVTTTPQWLQFNFSTPPTVAASTVYYLTWWVDAISNGRYVAGSSGQLQYDVLTYNGWPNPLVPDGNSARKLSIYASYVEAPPPAAKTLVQAALISIPPLIALPTLGQILRFTEGC